MKAAKATKFIPFNKEHFHLCEAMTSGTLNRLSTDTFFLGPMGHVMTLWTIGEFQVPHFLVLPLFLWPPPSLSSLLVPHHSNAQLRWSCGAARLPPSLHSAIGRRRRALYASTVGVVSSSVKGNHCCCASKVQRPQRLLFCIFQGL